MTTSSRRIRCELITQSAPAHLQQIFTGFSTLARQRQIELGEHFVTRDSGGENWLLRVILDDRAVVYDVADKHLIDYPALEWSDFYFKRSYQESYVASLGPLAARVHPLGLNYEVYPDHADFAAVRRNFTMRRGLSRVRGALRALNLKPGFALRQQEFEGAARADNASDRILFLTRAWGPRDVSDTADANAVNDLRAACIERLRQHFGKRALAGFAPPKFAARKYPDLLIEDSRTTAQRTISRSCAMQPCA